MIMYELFKFLVIPFGLINTSTTFCKLMNNVLYDILYKFIVLYLDDIVIYSKFLEEHLMNLKLVFFNLREYVVYLKKKNVSYMPKRKKKN